MENLDKSEHELTKLLIVEDDQVHRMIIRKCASTVSLDAEEASSCEAAIRLLDSGTYDCMTLDLSIGSRDGLDVLQHLVGSGRRMPILVVSGGEPGQLQAVTDYAEKFQLPILFTMKKPMDLAALKVLLVELKKLADQGRSVRKAWRITA